MRTDIPQTMVWVGPHPLLRFLAAFPIACFSAALVTDIAYVGTQNYIYTDFSDWLLAGGMAMGVLAAIVGLVDLGRRRRVPGARPGAALVLGSLVVLALGFVNNLVHSRDAWTSVMPLGLLLSVLTVIVILATALMMRPSAVPVTTYAGVRP